MIVNNHNLEVHRVITEDDYILQLLRIPQDGIDSDIKKTGDGLQNETSLTTPKPAVLLVHGLNSDGCTWLLNTPDKVLPCKLAAEGFDCWIASLRGTRISKGHATLTPKSKKYWDFSTHEHAALDIPACIDYILKTTGNEKLYCVTHSMGGPTIFITSLLRPEYNSKIHLLICLSPAVYIKHGTNRIVRMVGRVGAFVGKYKFIYRKESFPKTFAECGRKLCPPFLNRQKFGIWLMMKISRSCESIGHKEQVEKSRRAMIAEHVASPTSIKTVCHISQCMVSGQFRQYDYGRSENLKRYGNPTPPFYDMNKVPIPTITFGAVGDKLVPTKDVIQVSKELGNVLEYREISQPKFTHADLIFGADAHKLAYDPIIEILKKIENVTHL